MDSRTYQILNIDNSAYQVLNTCCFLMCEPRTYQGIEYEQTVHLKLLKYLYFADSTTYLVSPWQTYDTRLVMISEYKRYVLNLIVLTLL